MQPILAESAPHRGRALALAGAATALAVALSVLAVGHTRPSHRDHHRLHHLGRCAQTTSYFVR